MGPIDFADDYQINLIDCHGCGWSCFPDELKNGCCDHCQYLGAVHA